MSYIPDQVELPDLPDLRPYIGDLHHSDLQEMGDMGDMMDIGHMVDMGDLQDLGDVSDFLPSAPNLSNGMMFLEVAEDGQLVLLDGQPLLEERVMQEEPPSVMEVVGEGVLQAVGQLVEQVEGQVEAIKRGPGAPKLTPAEKAKKKAARDAKDARVSSFLEEIEGNEIDHTNKLRLKCF